MTHAYHNTETQKHSLRGVITSLMQDLQNLAPHPAHPNHKGTLFVQQTAAMRLSNDHDTMLGSLIAENMLGGIFADAVNDTVSDATDGAITLDLNDTLECYSAYITDIDKDKDRAPANDAAPHGRGSYARYAKASIAKSFNMRNAITQGMQNFLNDLPQRLRIEKHIAAAAKELADLDAGFAPHHAHEAAPHYAA